MASSSLKPLLNAGRFLVFAELRPLRHYNENSFIAELGFLEKMPCLSIKDELFEHLGGQYSRVDLKKNLDLIDWIRAIKGIPGSHMRSIRTGDCKPWIVESAGLRQVLA